MSSGGIGWGGYEIWKIRKSGKSVNVLPTVVAILEKAKSPTDEAEKEPQVSQEELVRQEAERQREMERKRQRKEEERRRALEKKHSAEYFAVRESFVGARLAYWSELPKNRRPGAVEGEFGLAVPRGRGKCEYFQIASTTNGVTVRRLSEKVPPQDVPELEYKKLMMDHGGFFLKDGTAYFVSGSNDKKSWTPPTRYSESFSPAEALFDDAYPIVGDRSLDTTGRSFEIFFSLDDKSTPIRIGEVPFDGEIRYAAFAEAAKDIALNMRKTGKRPQAKKIKRTVVFYDGVKIHKDIKGVTKIPRTWTLFEQGYSKTSYYWMPDLQPISIPARRSPAPGTRGRTGGSGVSRGNGRMAEKKGRAADGIGNPEHPLRRGCHNQAEVRKKTHEEENCHWPAHSCRRLPGVGCRRQPARPEDDRRFRTPPVRHPSGNSTRRTGPDSPVTTHTGHHLPDAGQGSVQG